MRRIRPTVVVLAALAAVLLGATGVTVYATVAALGGAGAPVGQATSPAAARPTGPTLLHLRQAAQVRAGGSAAIITPTGPTYPPGDHVVVFTVAIDCTDGQFGFSSADLYVVTASGLLVEAGQGRAPAEMGGVPVVYGTLGAGERRSGPVAFDMTSSHGTLYYDPGRSGSPVARWAF